jgi:oligopeptide/dipeptide ABC transporter ATP-binding protein
MKTILQVESLKKYFPIKRGLLKRNVGAIKAVDDVSFSIPEGQVFGLVGESGCGKSTVGRTILRLYEPTEGKIFFGGRDITTADKRSIKKIRKEMQIIFQDPQTSLNPRVRVGTIIDRAMKIHTVCKGSDRRDKVLALMERMGLSPEYYYRYPHELSGGQQQRVGIARALAVEPRFIVLDEATSALDVSVQAQILNLLKRLQRDSNLTYLFISHNLSVIDHICDRIAVMYVGKIMELADRDSLFKNPVHPYTRALFSSIPEAGKKKGGARIVLKGEVPSPANPPSGCRFHPRCIARAERCNLEEPQLREVETNHLVACHLI